MDDNAAVAEECIIPFDGRDVHIGIGCIEFPVVGVLRCDFSVLARHITNLTILRIGDVAGYRIWRTVEWHEVATSGGAVSIIRDTVHVDVVRKWASRRDVWETDKLYISFSLCRDS